MRYPYLAARVFDTPLLMSKRKLGVIVSAIGPRLGVALRRGSSTPEIYSDDEEDADLFEPTSAANVQRSYVLDRGVARIPVFGTLVHRAFGVSAMSGVTSYIDLCATFNAAIEDDAAHAILLEIDSPGGEANGAFDFADEIYAARGIKPIVAIANDWADSGAYLIASAADHLVVTQTGEVGSIGVVWSHVDYSAQNKMMGEAVTYLYAGERKIDGNPDQPLSDTARAVFSAEINGIYELFVNAVSRNRDMSADDVRATQAGVYRAEDGVAIGLADEVSTLKQILNSLADEAHPPESVIGAVSYSAAIAQTKERHMSARIAAPAGADPAQPNNPNPPTNPPPAHPQPAPPSDPPQQPATQISAGDPTIERARIASIIGCDEAKGRETLAHHLAFGTGMSASDAKALLAKAPTQAVPAVAVDPLNAVMQSVKNPTVGADAGPRNDDADADTLAASIVSVHRGVNGRGQPRSN